MPPETDTQSPASDTQSPASDTQSSAPTLQSPAPQNDVAGLRSALQAERQRANQLQGQLTQLQQQIGDLDLDIARQALTERDRLQEQVQTLTSQVHSRDIELTANNVLSAVLPEYRELFRSTVHSQLQVNEQGQVTVADGRSLDQVATDLKQRYPTMFAADQVATGAGIAPSNGVAPPATQRVSGSNVDAISQLDPVKVAAGEVVIDPTQ